MFARVTAAIMASNLIAARVIRALVTRPGHPGRCVVHGRWPRRPVLGVLAGHVAALVGALIAALTVTGFGIG
jgi:hypothetical protein